MSTIYTKSRVVNKRKIGKVLGLLITCIGISIVGYIFMPLLLWQLTIAPVFASQNIAMPIPKQIVVNSATIQSLIANSVHTLGVNYDDATNWFPGYVQHPNAVRVTSYTLSIPKLHIASAYVSTIDNDLGKHLVHFGGTAIPPDKGTAVIFGHSTLVQLFNPSNYHTIFANLYTLQEGDTIYVIVNNVTYTYKVFAMVVVDPDDTAILAQNYDDSYISIVTCTPPGTTWKRLIVQARLQKI